MEKIVNIWLRIISFGLIIFNLVLSFLYNNIHEEGIFILIGGGIAILCGNKCAEFSNRINKNQNLAYIVGFLFCLLGLLGYWIYYKTKENKLKC